MGDDSKTYFFSYQELFKKIQSKPLFLWGIIGLVGLGFVLLLSSPDKENANIQNNKVSSVQNPDISEYSSGTKRQMERELAQALGSIAGVGQVKVELNLKSSSRKVWERQLNVTKRVTQEQGVMNTEETNNDQIVIAKGLDGRDNPILKEELAPEVQGVIVVASGAEDARIKELLMSTVMTILNLPAHRVMVLAGKNEGDPNQ
jgi:stage III sporulation protein AG